MSDREVKLELETSNLKADLKKLKDELALNKQSEHCPLVSPDPQKSRASAGGYYCFVAKVLITNSPSDSGAG